jgi:NAD(P)-dependent dehydrogenase (short-subunit alcohol dehydrogenase family)
LRRQVAGSGVTVSLVSPGNINTAMTRHVAARMPGPGLVASAIVGLVRHPHREIVVPRKHYVIAWLERMLPSVADLLHQWRNWSPVENEAVGWNS